MRERQPGEKVSSEAPKEAAGADREMSTAAALALIVSVVIVVVFYSDLRSGGRMSDGFSGVFVVILAGMSAGLGLIIALAVVSMKLGTRAGRVAGLVGGIPPTALYLILRSGQDRGARGLSLASLIIALCAMYGYSALGAWLGRADER